MIIIFINVKLIHYFVYYVVFILIIIYIFIEYINIELSMDIQFLIFFLHQ